MLTIDPKSISTAQLQGYLQGSVGPRPIAFASTMDADGNANVSPFSFFNVFSANPPILIFSPARRVRDNTIKHTLINVEATKEVVINVVNYDIVQQISLASTEYADGVDEFVKSGLTPVASDIVKPYRVKESPVQFECKVNQIIALGSEGGAGNLVVCEVVKIHIDEAVLDSNGAIDQHKIDLVSRLGGNWYSRSNQGLFEVPKPLATLGIGVDAIPDFIKQSPVFNGNDLGILGNVEALPTTEEVSIFVQQNFAVKAVLSSDDPEKVQLEAKKYLNENDVDSAWKVLLAEPSKQSKNN
ncbi:flavin reductase family protein [Flavobacterium turcicum]|uniref:Flavin reductase family protein n=1 Tax=Flavobacterium turcicum TaxID=2764718 RepID=A0ABR7JCS8_9FLAO|nr:flavin reductase family protein [Flavobacterium turcicum]MBC5862311.1 flavin reductase family protein [Flavobacterium turcicum]NHL01042.1 flavin reductase family protein [Flavobacterium turcicum]